MPNKFNAKNVVKGVERELKKEFAKMKPIPIPTQVDVSSNHRFTIGHNSFPTPTSTNITTNNFDNRGAIIGAIGNNNSVHQNIINSKAVELSELILSSKKEINDLDIDDDKKEWLLHNLDSCQAQMESNIPKLSFIKRFTTAVQNELQMIKDSFLSLTKDVAPITTLMVNIPKIYELAKSILDAQ
jgi:hypothetical protein